MKLKISTIGLLLLLLGSTIFSAEKLRVVNFSSDVPGITPFSSFDPDSYSVITQIFDSMIHIDLNGKRVPGLALSWKLVDKKSYEFVLRQGVKFHNGEEFNAEAVKFSYEKFIDPATKAGNAWIFSTIKSVEIVGPYRVRIHLKHPDGMFLFRLSMFGAIVPPKYVERVGLEAFNKKPVGTGPFQFVNWQKGSEIVLKKNPNYWQANIPFFDELVFKILPGDQWLAALERGEVDVITNVHSRDLAKVEANPDLKAMKRLVLQGYWVFLKNDGPLADVNVRKALNLAVDKKNLIKVQGNGLGKPLASLGKIGEIGKNPTLKPYPYNIEKAKKLLKTAGYANGFSIKAIAIEQAEPLSKALVKDLARIGVKVEL